MKRHLGILSACFIILPSFSHGETPSSAIETRVDGMMAKLTLEQKIDLLGGVDEFYVRGFDHIGLPKLRMADGPSGARNAGASTAYAAGIALAATWNPEVAEQVGIGIGRDARARGAHFLLGPGVNIYRAPQCGRNFEYFGEDPLLAAALTVGYIRGIQSQGVIATVKHFMGNNSEYDRHYTNSIIDERAKREIYLPAFEAAVKQADVGAIMTSYNLVDGEYASHSRHLIHDIAKQDWGFRGIMMSDWFATYDGLAAANAGLDLEMPVARYMNRETLLPAIKDGRLSEAVIDDKVRRILRTVVRFGFPDRPQHDPLVPLNDPRNREIAMRGAEQAITLLKNDGVLPIRRDGVRRIALIGPSAWPAVVAGGGSGHVKPFRAVSALDALTDSLGTGTTVLYDRGILPMADVLAQTAFTKPGGGDGPPVKVEYFATKDLTGPVTRTMVAKKIDFFADEPVDPQEVAQPFSSARYTTTFVPKTTGIHHWFTDASTRDAYKLFIDGKPVLQRSMDESRGTLSYSSVLEAGKSHDVRFEIEFGLPWGPNKIQLGVISQDDMLSPAAAKLAAAADVAIVMVGYEIPTEAEGFDRSFSLPAGQDALIQAIAAANKNTVVAVTAGGAVDATAWIDQVPALLHLWYPGQEGGAALSRILLGEISPSGRLPISWERSWKDNPVHDSYYINGQGKDVHYREGVFVGYRGYQQNGVKPLFPFGFGLSYSTFKYGDLKISPASPKPEETVTVTFNVTNTGTMAADDVAQLYLGDPVAGVPRPPRELKGFQRVALKPGETKQVSLPLDSRSRSYYDVSSSAWKQESGEFRVFVGRSSEELLLKGGFNVTE